MEVFTFKQILVIKDLLEISTTEFIGWLDITRQTWFNWKREPDKIKLYNRIAMTEVLKAKAELDNKYYIIEGIRKYDNPYTGDD